MIEIPPFHKNYLHQSYILKLNFKKYYLKTYNQNESLKLLNRNNKILRILSDKEISPKLLFSTQLMHAYESIQNGTHIRLSDINDENLKLIYNHYEKINKLSLNEVPRLQDFFLNYFRLMDQDKEKFRILKNIKKKEDKIIKFLAHFNKDELCHGDFHLGNIIIQNKKVYFLDFDYLLKFSKIYDVAMICYFDKFKEKHLSHIANIFEVDKEELLQFIPICKILDSIWIVQNKLQLKQELISDINSFLQNI